MNSAPRQRPAIEQRLLSPKYAYVRTSIKAIFVNEDWGDERDYWDYALGLRDSWTDMSRAPAKEVKKTVSELAQLARTLANTIRAHAPELKTLKGYLDVDLHSFMAEDLIGFADDLDKPNPPTEAMMSRPRSMASKTAERTYIARALSHYLLSGEKVSGRPFRKRDSLVAMTVCALLDIGANDEFNEKNVSDITADIVARYRSQDKVARLASAINSL